MDNFLAFFGAMETWQKFIWLTFVLFLCWSLEFLVPLYRSSYAKLRHASKNFVFLGFSSAINLVLHPLVILIALWTGQQNFGLLHLTSWPVWLELLVAFIVFDFFAQYVAHVALHKVPFLFRFHRIHHSDTHVDATTGSRHHPIDYVVRESMSLFVILSLGAPAAYYVFYRMATLFFSYLIHANILNPRWLDRTLGLLLVTPNIHKFHHHDQMPWTDTNYGGIFSIWDRIFGTLVVDDPAKVSFGLDVMDPARDEDVLYQLTSPFDSSIKSVSQIK